MAGLTLTTLLTLTLSASALARDADLARAQHQRRAHHRSSSASTRAARAVAAAGSSGAISTGTYQPIAATMTSEATSALATSYTAGSSPSAVSSAPALPAASSLVIANYPALDQVPPTNSAEVQGWLKEIDLSQVPSYGPTGIGGCSNTTTNAQAVAQAGSSGRCWWTCGGCTRDEDITVCPDKGTWGTSYDDGPSPDTTRLLSYLDANKLKTTFFVVGSRVLSRPQLLQYEYMDGHQISVHTWSHPSLTTLTNEQIVAELGWSKKVIKDTIGVTPNTFRPPYGDIDDRVRYIAKQMGLTPIIWTSIGSRTFDTEDWQIAAGTVTPSAVLTNFEQILSNYTSLSTGFIVLEHDLYEQSVDLAVEFVLPRALQDRNLKLEPIVTCLGQGMGEAYIETSSNSSSSSGSGSGSASSGGSGGGKAASGTGSANGASGTGSSSGTGSASAASSSGKSGAGAVAVGYVGLVSAVAFGALATLFA